MALGIARAKRQGIPVDVLPQLSSKDYVFWSEFAKHLNRIQISQILLLGFMKIIPPQFIENFKGSIINLHPSLLPHYKGLNAIERSYEDKAPMGVSVHQVTPELDGGPILRQSSISDTLSADSYTLTLEKAHFLISLLEQRIIEKAVLLKETPWRVKALLL